MSTRITATGAVAALVLAACGAAGLAGGSAARPGAADEGGAAAQGGLAPPDFTCALAAERRDGTTLVEARVTARRAVAGSFTLTIEAAGGGMRIEQGGDFTAREGETLVLGQTALAGAPRIAGRFELATGAGRVRCPIRPPLEPVQERGR